MKTLIRISIFALILTASALRAEFARGYLDSLAETQKNASQYLEVSESAKSDYDEASRLMNEAEKEHSKGNYSKSTELARKSDQKFKMIIRTKGKGLSKPSTKPSGDQTAAAKKAEDKLASVKAKLARKERGDRAYSARFTKIDRLIMQAENAMKSKNYTTAVSNCDAAEKELNAIPDKKSDTPSSREDNDSVAQKKSADKIAEAKAMRDEKSRLLAGKSDSNYSKGESRLKRAEEMFAAKQYGDAGRSADDAKAFFIRITGKKTDKEIQAEKRAQAVKKKQDETVALVAMAEESKKNSVLKQTDVRYRRAEEDLANAKKFFDKGAYESAKSKAKQAAKKFSQKD